MAYTSRRKMVAVLIAVSVAAAAIGILALNSLVIQNAGNVQTVNIDVYWDSGHSDRVSAIDWGTVEAGTTRNITVYILNAGNSDVTLSKSTANWSSSNASDYINLSWDYSGQKIVPGQARKTTFTLIISSDIHGVTSFNFDTVITGNS